MRLRCALTPCWRYLTLPSLFHAIQPPRGFVLSCYINAQKWVPSPQQSQPSPQRTALHHQFRPQRYFNMATNAQFMHYDLNSSGKMTLYARNPVDGSSVPLETQGSLVHVPQSDWTNSKDTNPRMPPVKFNAYCSVTGSQPLSLQRILLKPAAVVNSWLVPYTDDTQLFGPNGFQDSEIQLKIRVRVVS